MPTRIASAVLLGVTASAFGAGPAHRKMTLASKTVGTTKIHADLHRFAETKSRPVLVWIHGGDRKLVEAAHAKRLAFARRHLSFREP